METSGPATCRLHPCRWGGSPPPSFLAPKVHVAHMSSEFTNIDLRFRPASLDALGLLDKLQSKATIHLGTAICHSNRQPAKSRMPYFTPFTGCPSDSAANLHQVDHRQDRGHTVQGQESTRLIHIEVGLPNRQLHGPTRKSTNFIIRARPPHRRSGSTVHQALALAVSSQLGQPHRLQETPAERKPK